MMIEQLDDIAFSFVGWQCRLRQHVVRRGDGRPSPGMYAAVILPDGRELGSIITVLVKADPADAIAQFRHIVRKTHDPLERYEAGIKMLQTVYYQYPREFSDQPTALFAPDSVTAETLREAGRCTLVFEQGGQRYSVPCATTVLREDDPAHAATYWHNAMFNPNLAGPAAVIRFTPEWSDAIAEPGDGRP